MQDGFWGDGGSFWHFCGDHLGACKPEMDAVTREEYRVASEGKLLGPVLPPLHGHRSRSGPEDHVTPTLILATVATQACGQDLTNDAGVTLATSITKNEAVGRQLGVPNRPLYHMIKMAMGQLLAAGTPDPRNRSAGRGSIAGGCAQG